MRTNTDIDRLCREAEQARRCLHPTTDARRHAIMTRVKAGTMLRVHRNTYVRAAYWKTLNASERARHVIRSLSRQHANYTFAGLSAAAILHLEYEWNLHRDGAITIVSATGRSARCHRNIKRIIARNPPVRTIVHRIRENDSSITMLPETDSSSPSAADATDVVRITSPARTLVDCGLRYTFLQSLPMFDSALRRNLVTRDEIMDICDGLRTDCGPVMRLLYYANPLNENGGESLCYATIIDEGFAVPQLQHAFADPDAPWNTYRVDFVWHTSDGRIIVLEYDGTGKYIDPSITGRRGIQDVVHDERLREDALRRAGVTSIIRATYDEVKQRAPLIHKLMDGNVPMAGMHPMYERWTDISGREH